MQNALYPHSCSILLLIDQHSRDTVPLMYSTAYNCYRRLVVRLKYMIKSEKKEKKLEMFHLKVEEGLHFQFSGNPWSCGCETITKVQVNPRPFPRYNMKCRGKRDTTRNIPRSI